MVVESVMVSDSDGLLVKCGRRYRADTPPPRPPSRPQPSSQLLTGAQELRSLDTGALLTVGWCCSITGASALGMLGPDCARVMPARPSAPRAPNRNRFMIFPHLPSGNFP